MSDDGVTTRRSRLGSVPERLRLRRKERGAWHALEIPQGKFRDTFSRLSTLNPAPAVCVYTYAPSRPSTPVPASLRLNEFAAWLLQEESRLLGRAELRPGGSFRTADFAAGPRRLVYEGTRGTRPARLRGRRRKNITAQTCGLIFNRREQDTVPANNYTPFACRVHGLFSS